MTAAKPHFRLAVKFRASTWWDAWWVWGKNCDWGGREEWVPAVDVYIARAYWDGERAPDLYARRTAAWPPPP